MNASRPVRSRPFGQISRSLGLLALALSPAIAAAPAAITAPVR